MILNSDTNLDSFGVKRDPIIKPTALYSLSKSHRKKCIYKAHLNTISCLPLIEFEGRAGILSRESDRRAEMPSKTPFVYFDIANCRYVVRVWRNEILLSCKNSISFFSPYTPPIKFKLPKRASSLFRKTIMNRFDRE